MIEEVTKVKALDRAKLGKANKRKGSTAERLYASEFRDMGFPHCKTSRLGSKLHDSCGLDLIFVPYNVQIKSGEQRGLSFPRELRYMTDRLKEMFPSESIEHSLPRIVIHHRFVTSGQKRTPEDSLVTMTFEDFKRLVSKIQA